MPESILFPKYNSVLLLLFPLLLVVNTSNNASWGLPADQAQHVLLSLLAHRLYQSILFGVALRRTDKSCHHNILCDCFSSIYCLIIKHEVSAIGPPAELWAFAKDIFGLIDWNLVNEVEFLVELDEGFIIGYHIKVVLGWRNRCSCDTILVLSLYIDNSVLADCENAAILPNTQYLFLFDQPLQQQNRSTLEFLQWPLRG